MTVALAIGLVFCTSIILFHVFSLSSPLLAHHTPQTNSISLKLSHVLHSSGDTFKQFTTSDHSRSSYTTAQQALLDPFDVPVTAASTPDPSSPRAVLTLATMTLNAYYEPERDGWRDVPGWNKTTRFGWDNDGIRGYVYANDDTHEPSQRTVVITFKGTSARWIGGGGMTSPRDKLNDNLMFSCCCASVDRTWTPSCSCKTAENQCSAACIQKDTNIPDSYYNLAQTIFMAVRGMYGADTKIWVTGHSLGGALASLVALTNNVPAFTFEAPGDLLFASRIGLVSAPRNASQTLARDEQMKDLEIYHYGNDGDPIFLGKCTGPGSTCWWGGYAMESKCHVGKVCTYPLNAVKKMSARIGNAGVDASGLDIRHHGIKFMIDEILSEEPDVPACVVEEACNECEQWQFS